ncbi:MAG: GntR family transcriptional regulator [Treponema sp.]|jgi:hypothetical protein|nr:GntR family transcriptional regulator [Treponema sp.]
MEEHQGPLLSRLAVKYKKSWLVNAWIARELAGCSVGDQLPTIQEFTGRLGSSRGVVQKALDELQAKGGVSLEKRGKMGTYITALRREELFRLGGMEFITGTMPPPMTGDLISLASGISGALSGFPVPFHFAFIHGSGNRGAALSRIIYDFAVTSLAGARRLCAKYPGLTQLTSLEGCVYSPPFVLCSSRPGVSAPADGDTIAADPASVDQYHLTQKICRGKNVRIIERPYNSCWALFLAGDADFLVFRYYQSLRDAKVAVSPIESGGDPDFITPAVLINTNNYHIAAILKPYLDPRIIAEGQAAVKERRQAPQIY